MTTDKLKAVAEEIAAEGWKWIAVASTFPTATRGLRALARATVDLTDEERAERDSLRDEYPKIEGEYEDHDELPDEIDQRLGEIETALEAFENRPVIFDPSTLPLPASFVSIDRDGELSSIAVMCASRTRCRSLSQPRSPTVIPRPPIRMAPMQARPPYSAG